MKSEKSENKKKCCLIKFYSFLKLKSKIIYRKISKFVALNFDRSFSAGVWMQFLWLVGIVVLSGGLMWLLHPDYENFTFRSLVELYIDHGNFNSGNSAIDNASTNSVIYAFVVAIIGSVLFGGALISVLTNMLNVRVDKYRSGDVSYPENNHILIIGYQRMVPALVKQLTEHVKYKDCDIVILTSSPIEEVKHRLRSQLDSNIDKRVIFIYGRQTSKEDLKRACVNLASKVYLLGEENQYDHDALSIEALEAIASVCKESKCEGRVTCETLIQYQTTYAIFKQQQLDDDVTKYVDFIPFCYEESWAHRIFVTGKYQMNNGSAVVYNTLDNNQMGVGSKKRVHLVVIGTSKIGVALAKQAALIAHYPNFISDKIKTKITFIDANCYAEMLQIVGSNAELFAESEYSYRNIEKGEDASENFSKSPGKSFLDVEWEFIEGRVESFEVKQYLKDLSNNDNEIITIASCLNYSPTSIAIGLYLPREVYESENVVQVLVNQQSTDSIIGVLKTEGMRYKKVKPFGMMDICCDLEYDKLVDKAKQINYIYNVGKVPSALASDTVKEELWATLDPPKRWSNIYNASTISAKLRVMGLENKPYKDWNLTKADFDILAALEHNRWNIEELILGYRAASDEEKKIIAADFDVKEALCEGEMYKKKEYKNKFIHYDICPFDELQVDGRSIGEEKAQNVNRYDYVLSKSLHLFV